jgi:hypothetical protein
MPEVQSRRLGHGEWPPALTRMFYARRNWPTLLRRHPARRETAAQAADLPEAAPADTRAAPRGSSSLPLRALHRPLASGQRRTVTGQLTSNPHPDKPNHHRLSVRGHATKPYSSPIAQPGGISGFAGLLYSAHPKRPRGRNVGRSEGVRGVSLEELDVLGVDRQGRLYRDGIPVHPIGTVSRCKVDS